MLRDLELHLWKFAANGKVARFRHVVDTHQHWLCDARLSLRGARAVLRQPGVK
jgi:hypothetical protein